MTLTRHLAQADSPVRQYLERAFGNVAAVRRADDASSAGGVFRPGDPIVPPPAGEPDAPRYASGLVGTAFDYMVRLLLAPQNPWSFTAAKGAYIHALVFKRKVEGAGWVELANELSGWPFATDVEDRLTRECVLLAYYEQLHGALGRIDDHPLLYVDPDTPLDELLGLADDRVTADVAALARAFVQSNSDIVEGHDVVSNPTFELSHPLDGADADIIVDGTLIELKAVQTAVLNKSTLWQVLGYLLADTSDTYEIRAVAWYFARHGYRWQLPVEEFLHRLHGAPITLAQAREGFRVAVLD